MGIDDDDDNDGDSENHEDDRDDDDDDDDDDDNYSDDDDNEDSNDGDDDDGDRADNRTWTKHLLDVKKPGLVGDGTVRTEFPASRERTVRRLLDDVVLPRQTLNE